MKFTNLLYANGNLTLKMKMAYKWRVDLKFGIHKYQVTNLYWIFIIPGQNLQILNVDVLRVLSILQHNE